MAMETLTTSKTLNRHLLMIENCSSPNIKPLCHRLAMMLFWNRLVRKGRIWNQRKSCVRKGRPSEFITHRAKDFLSSIKDIEHRFFRASESGKEVSRMLEASKIRLKSSETKGRSPAIELLAAFHLACCRGDNVIPNEPPQQVTKVITWHRSVSSRSSSSKNPLNSASKDDISDSGSDFVDEFCMITGSHSSTLERLYAWERKLYDEVKASESIRKAYDYWCDHLRQQFARDAKVGD
ncbi:hypothetical protein IFM89_021987 [Coptis chinensis]|uniref:DUF632 domain-containing protein n=1 Tax=Coptis chinensis TaxID=261450 RepID=A0A835I617_9MAGN|nr:hypothetical protein IFM89_021987 [Coptis chinensis]